MKKIPLSVFLIVKNEEKRIAKTLEALRGFADEVLVIDSGSTDNTVKIADFFGAKVIYHEWQGYGQQKIFGQEQCKNDWILNIDADEVLTEEVKKEITKLFTSGKVDNYYGYRVRIVNLLQFEEKPKKLAYYYNQTRLYNKNKAGFRESSVHDCVIVDGIKEYSKEEKKIIGQLKGKISHHFIISYTHWIEKLNRVTQMQALDSFKKGKKVSGFKVLFAPSIAFFKALFVRRYFIYGVDGIVMSFLYANSRLYKYIKIRELWKIKNNENL